MCTRESSSPIELPAKEGPATRCTMPSLMPSVQSRTVRVGLLTPINELDPRRAVDYVSGMILDQIFEPPYSSVAGQRSLFEPLRNEDAGRGLQYSAAVRPGVVFSDGSPLTAALAARSLREAGILAGKATVSLRDDRVGFSLSSPNPRFDLTLTQGGCAIVLDNGHQLFGTGPYRFDERPLLRDLQRAQRVRLVRNPHHDGAAKVDEIEFHVLPPESDGTPRALVDALHTGVIDLTTALSASDLVTWNITGVSPVTKPSNSTAFLYMNTDRSPLDGAPARKALASAIDLLEIASRSYDRMPAAFVATTALPPAMSRGGGGLRLDSVDAARLIETSGLRGARLSMAVPWAPRPYLVKPMAVAKSIRQQFADAGVAITLVETRSSDEYFDILTTGRFDLALGGWIADTADPADFFDALLSSHAVGNNNFANHSRWSDAATDAMLAGFRVDPSDRNRAELERIIAEGAPFVPLVYGQSCVVHGRRVRNVTVSPTGSMALATMSVS